MCDYISREFVDKAILREYYDGNGSTAEAMWRLHLEITREPAADVAPVVHGEWEPSDKHKGFVSCSVCHDCYVEPEWVSDLKWRYCPNCGAEMKNGDER